MLKNSTCLVLVSQLFLDSEDKLARFSVREDEEERVYIQDLSRGVSYVRSDDKSCYIQNYLGIDEDGIYTGGRSFAKSLPQILFMDGEGFYYLGQVKRLVSPPHVTLTDVLSSLFSLLFLQTMRRRILTNVYEKTLRNHKFDLFDSEGGKV